MLDLIRQHGWMVLNKKIICEKCCLEAVSRGLGSMLDGAWILDQGVLWCDFCENNLMEYVGKENSDDQQVG